MSLDVDLSGKTILVCGVVADYAGIRTVAAGGGSVVILSGLLWFLLRRRAAGEQIGKKS